jgi:hypothetical protein
MIYKLDVKHGDIACYSKIVKFIKLLNVKGDKLINLVMGEPFTCSDEFRDKINSKTTQHGYCIKPWIPVEIP